MAETKYASDGAVYRQIIDPVTKQPVVRVLNIEDVRREYVRKLEADRERERLWVERAAEVVPDRYSLMPGRVLIRARPVETAWDSGGGVVEMTQDRIDMMRAHEPWGTILMVGGPFYTDHGQLMSPDPEWKTGRQVMFNPAGAQELELPVPGEDGTMALLLVGFRGILLVDRGPIAVFTTNITNVTAEEVEGAGV